MTPVHAQLSHTYAFNNIHFTYTKQFYTYNVTGFTTDQILADAQPASTPPFTMDPNTSKHCCIYLRRECNDVVVCRGWRCGRIRLISKSPKTQH